ncbi:MAG: hypothetical protein A2W64_02645 [Candidatus Zambryskibacteria bacterium RIFCSPLOWO2_02_39_10]|nr:MAG: hypothetical protein A2W64_02645 [Candidatus Zambryskibacteria bacterium RIFCSPLOWO2_02_39_10]
MDILPLFKNFKRDFYLAEGTALALQIGHRDSVDFDFFGPENIDTKKLFEEISKEKSKRSDELVNFHNKPADH